METEKKLERWNKRNRTNAANPQRLLLQRMLLREPMKKVGDAEDLNSASN